MTARKNYSNMDNTSDIQEFLLSNLKLGEENISLVKKFLDQIGWELYSINDISSDPNWLGQAWIRGVVRSNLKTDYDKLIICKIGPKHDLRYTFKKVIEIMRRSDNAYMSRDYIIVFAFLNGLLVELHVHEVLNGP